MTVASDIIFTKDQEEAIEQLRQNMGKEYLLSMKRYNETTMLYRFLKARDWNVNQAEEMLRKAIEWRKENGLSTIRTDFKPPEVLKKYFENILVGYAKEDKSPVYYNPISKYDMNGLFKCVQVSDLQKHLLQIVENEEDYLEQNCKKLNSGFIYIFDFIDLPFALATNKKAIETWIKFSKIQQDIYPERLKTVYIINASSLFTFPFNIVKNFYPASMLNKIHVFGTEGYQEHLLKIIDADQLPAFLGGKRTDPDGNPLCKTLVQQAGKVDEKYYTQNKKSKSTLVNSPGVDRIVISRASFLEKPLHIKEAGSLIEWEFETKTRDIGFGLFYKEGEGDEAKIVELVPLQRLETEEFSETGMYKCDKAGDYVILFDNSYSWMRSKEIFYRITIVNPNEHEKRIKVA